MFRLIISHLQDYSLQVKSQDAAYTLGFQWVYISEIFKPNHLSRTVKHANCLTNWYVSLFVTTETQFVYSAVGTL